MNSEVIQTIAVYALPVLFAVTLHEAAHAYAARYFGDNTAYSQGRMSLNPMVHIDPFGTILLPVLMYMATSGGFLFGYAKPVPVNFGQLRKPKRDMAWVALAGPGANFIMAIGWMVALIVLRYAGVQEEFFLRMADAGVISNLMMFAFNLIPVPPLDGGRIAISLLPNKLAYKYAQLEPYGMIIVLVLMFLQVLKFWMIQLLSLGIYLVSLLTQPLLWLLQ